MIKRIKKETWELYIVKGCLMARIKCLYKLSAMQKTMFFLSNYFLKSIKILIFVYLKKKLKVPLFYAINLVP